MAKKDKKQKSARKKDGTKLSKDLRKTAETVMAIAQSPAAREMAAAALTAGAAALAKRSAVKPGAPGQSKIKATDVGALLAQGVALFLGNLDKPRNTPPTGGKPADNAANRKPD